MRLLIILLLTLISWAGYAQETEPEIKVLGKVINGEVHLRWAPSTPLAWQLGNRYGYIIERFTVNRNGIMDTLNPERTVVTPVPLTPIPQADFETIAMDNDMAAIAAQALYGEDFQLTDPSDNTMQFINETAELENRFSFALLAADHDVEVARALGLRWTNFMVNTNEKYVYRVSLAIQNKDYPVRSGSAFIDPHKEMKLPAPSEVQIEFGDQTIDISWNTFYHQQLYTSYKVERSDDGGKTYQAVDKLSFLNLRKEGQGQLERMHYLDSIAKNNFTYYFRVRGISPFGEIGPASVPVSGMGLSTVAGIVPVIDSVSIMESGKAYIHWRFPDEYRDKLEGFTIARARTAGGPFEDITIMQLSPKASSYMDQIPDMINYYIVKAHGKDGKFTKSFPAMLQPEDSIPPSSPTGLEGTIDDNGIVSLKWTANREIDLNGYRVFRVNNLREEYFQVTSSILKTPVFADSLTLQTLTEQVYYTVVAYDFHENPSEYSNPVKLKKPDKVPPAAPVFNKIENNESNLILHWQPSVSNDVVQYQLYRAQSGEADTLIAEVNHSEGKFFYEDNEVEQGFSYSYTLLAKDDDGLLSEKTVVTADVIDQGIRSAIKNIDVKIDREKKAVELTWKYPEATFSKVLLYRKKGSDPLRLYKTLSGDQMKFTDRYLTVNSTYYYQLKGILKDGNETELSEEVAVKY